MNKLVKDLPKPNRTTWQLIILLLVVSVPFYMFLLRPAQSDLAEKTSERTTIQTQRNAAQEKLKAYSTSPYTGDTLKGALAGIDSVLPDMAAAPSPLVVGEEIDSSASALGVTVTGLSVNDEYVNAGKVGVATIDFSATGSLSALESMVRQIQDRSQYTEVQIKTFSADSKGGGGYTATMTVNMYASTLAGLGQTTPTTVSE